MKSVYHEFWASQTNKDPMGIHIIQQNMLSSCFVLFVLFLWMPSFEGNWVSPMGFSLTSGAGVDGNAPYQAQELQITTLVNPGIQTNFLPPRLVRS